MTAPDTLERPPFFLVLQPNGQPYDRNMLSWHWNRERDTNVLLQPLSASELVLHGLRSTAVVRARKRGATVLQISSMFGMSEPMVARYSRLVMWAGQLKSLTCVSHRDGRKRHKEA